MSATPIQAAAERDPDGLALVDGQGRLTWGETDRLLTRLGTWLARVAGGPGQRVAVLGDNLSATLLTHTAAILAGVGTVATAKQLRPAELVDQFTDAGVTAVVTGPAGADAALEAAHRLGPLVVAVHGTPDGGNPTWRSWTGPTGSEPRPDPDEPPPHAVTRDGSADRDTRPAVPPLVYTSGTTGRARGTEVRWVAGPAGTAAGYAAALARGNSFPAGPHLVCGPLQHNGPLTSIRHLLAGQPVVILPGFEARAALSAIAEHRVTSTMMVPTHFQRLLALDPGVRAGFDVSSLRLVAHTGSACRAEVKRAMIDWFGPVLVESYGASELGTVARIRSAEWLAHPGSVGRAVAPFELVVLDGAGRPVPAGETGRIAVRAPEERGIRYHADPAKTAEAAVAPGLYTLGDRGHLDPDGYLFVTGRDSDMVISGGVNLYPAEPEAVLREQPGVADVAVIGVPHTDLGEALHGLVVPVPGQAAPDPAELDRACRAALAGPKCPKSYELVDELPRNAMGKVDKQVLRARY